MTVISRDSAVSKEVMQTVIIFICFFTKANNEDPFNSSATGSMNSVIITKNIFEEPPAKNEDIPPALPPKTGTPTRPCPPPPGRRQYYL